MPKNKRKNKKPNKEKGAQESSPEKAPEPNTNHSSVSTSTPTAQQKPPKNTPQPTTHEEAANSDVVEGSSSADDRTEQVTTSEAPPTVMEPETHPEIANNHRTTTTTAAEPPTTTAVAGEETQCEGSSADVQLPTETKEPEVQQEAQQQAPIEELEEQTDPEEAQPQQEQQQKHETETPEEAQPAQETPKETSIQEQEQEQEQEQTIEEEQAHDQSVDNSTDPLSERQTVAQDDEQQTADGAEEGTTNTTAPQTEPTEQQSVTEPPAQQSSTNFFGADGDGTEFTGFGSEPPPPDPFQQQQEPPSSPKTPVSVSTYDPFSGGGTAVVDTDPFGSSTPSHPSQTAAVVDTNAAASITSNDPFATSSPGIDPFTSPPPTTPPRQQGLSTPQQITSPVTTSSHDPFSSGDVPKTATPLFGQDEPPKQASPSDYFGNSPGEDPFATSDNSEPFSVSIDNTNFTNPNFEAPLTTIAADPFGGVTSEDPFVQAPQNSRDAFAADPFSTGYSSSNVPQQPMVSDPFGPSVATNPFSAGSASSTLAQQPTVSSPTDPFSQSEHFEADPFSGSQGEDPFSNSGANNDPFNAQPQPPQPTTGGAPQPASGGALAPPQQRPNSVPYDPFSTSGDAQVTDPFNSQPPLPPHNAVGPPSTPMDPFSTSSNGLTVVPPLTPSTPTNHASARPPPSPHATTPKGGQVLPPPPSADGRPVLPPPPGAPPGHASPPPPPPPGSPPAHAPPHRFPPTPAGPPREIAPKPTSEPPQVQQGPPSGPPIPQEQPPSQSTATESQLQEAPPQGPESTAQQGPPIGAPTPQEGPPKGTASPPTTQEPLSHSTQDGPPKGPPPQTCPPSPPPTEEHHLEQDPPQEQPPAEEEPQEALPSQEAPPVEKSDPPNQTEQQPPTTPTQPDPFNDPFNQSTNDPFATSTHDPFADIQVPDPFAAPTSPPMAPTIGPPPTSNSYGLPPQSTPISFGVSESPQFGGSTSQVGLSQSMSAVDTFSQSGAPDPFGGSTGVFPQLQQGTTPQQLTGTFPNSSTQSEPFGGPQSVTSGFGNSQGFGVSTGSAPFGASTQSIGNSESFGASGAPGFGNAQPFYQQPAVTANAQQSTIPAQPVNTDPFGNMQQTNSLTPPFGSEGSGDNNNNSFYSNNPTDGPNQFVSTGGMQTSIPLQGQGQQPLSSFQDRTVANVDVPQQQAQPPTFLQPQPTGPPGMGPPQQSNVTFNQPFPDHQLQPQAPFGQPQQPSSRQNSLGYSGSTPTNSIQQPQSWGSAPQTPTLPPNASPMFAQPGTFPTVSSQQDLQKHGSFNTPNSMQSMPSGFSGSDNQPLQPGSRQNSFGYGQMTPTTATSNSLQGPQAWSAPQTPQRSGGSTTGYSSGLPGAPMTPMSSMSMPRPPSTSSFSYQSGDSNHQRQRSNSNSYGPPSDGVMGNSGQRQFNGPFIGGGDQSQSVALDRPTSITSNSQPQPFQQQFGQQPPQGGDWMGQQQPQHQQASFGMNSNFSAPTSYGHGQPGFENQPNFYGNSFGQQTQLQQQPQRQQYTPNARCPPVSFGFGGRVLCVLPTQQTPGTLSPDGESTKPGPLQVAAVAALCERDPYINMLQTFPGPLTPSTSKDDVLKALTNLQNQKQSRHENDAESNEWRNLIGLLHIMVQQNGELNSGGNSPFEGVLQFLKNQPLPAMNSNEPLYKPTSVDPSVENNAMQMVQQLIMNGNRKEALTQATQAGLFTEALLIASMISREEFENVTSYYVSNCLQVNSPIATFHLVVNHRTAQCFGPNRIGAVNTETQQQGSFAPAFNICKPQESSLYKTWMQSLSVILVNSLQGCQRAVVDLGDALGREVRVYQAAHFCYLVAGGNMEDDVGKARMILLGGNHITPTNRHDFVSAMTIQLSMVFEYAKSRGNAQFTIPSLKLYKYFYTQFLNEVGLTGKALAYCQLLTQGKSAVRLGIPQLDFFELVDALKKKLGAIQALQQHKKSGGGWFSLWGSGKKESSPPSSLQGSKKAEATKPSPPKQDISTNEDIDAVLPSKGQGKKGKGWTAWIAGSKKAKDNDKEKKASQMILPDDDEDQDYYWDEKEKRYKFRNIALDPKEAEEAAQRAAGPPTDMMMGSTAPALGGGGVPPAGGPPGMGAPPIQPTPAGAGPPGAGGPPMGGNQFSVAGRPRYVDAFALSTSGSSISTEQ